MTTQDKSEKKARRKSSGAWDRDRMNETHRKGKRGAKKNVRRARRRVDKEVTRAKVK